MVNKADFISWRDSEVTQQMLKEVTETIESVASELLSRELPNLDRDTFLKGYLKGLSELASWRPVDFEEDSHEG